MISAGIVTVSYIAATILFILALGGLSNQETARRGNWYGIIGMTIALLATILGVVTETTRCCSARWLSAAASAYSGASRADDADAGTGCDPAQPGWSRRGRRRFRQLHGSECALRRRRTDDPRYRDLSRHPDRRGDVFRLDHRVRQTSRTHRRQAADAARAALVQSGSADGAIWFGREFVMQSAAGGGLEPLIIMTVIALCSVFTW